MSAFPKPVDEAYECNHCGHVYFGRDDARDCCPPERLSAPAWACGACGYGLHRYEGGAERCIANLASGRSKAR